MNLEELEALTNPPKHSGLLPVRDPVREYRYPGEFHSSPRYDERMAKMVVMGPVQQLPGWTCRIHHFLEGPCACTAPIVMNPEMLETAAASGMYVLGALKKSPTSKLGQDDLDFLAWSCSKMCAHWARRALGQEQLV